jgi:uncharacterized lipoprotein YmbA
MKRLSLIAAMLLAGCGSGGGDTHIPVPEPGPTTPTIDAFFAQVKTVVAALPDESEAASIDALAATAPEDSEPISL